MTVPLPSLNDRARGWLRFIWEKATTPDDWSSQGEPHPWWDRTTTAPMCAFPRFDLSETAYALPVMADVTPAWREVYTRIADELAGRYTTFWSAIDWITLIGPHPHPDRIPPEWQAFLPENLRGRYDPPGWTGNGIEPWGLQPDPIGSDGNLFFRGFFNLILSIYAYVSGSDKWEHPFRVTGCRDRLFEWSHRGIAQFLTDQWADRPQGPHCENTKIWPYCLSAAGLGLQLYEKISGGSFHWVYDRWVDFARKHFLRVDRNGGLDWFAFYYDPLEETIHTFPGAGTAYAALAPTLYILPQHPEFGRFLYESGVSRLGWNDPKKRVVQLLPDPRFLASVLVMAREVGDDVTEARLREVAEREFEPRFFGPDEDRFAWWFHLNEPYPRGQLNGLMILSELGGPGSWSSVFTRPNLTKFHEPTVEGVDYPTLGVSQAWNDLEEGVLWVETFAATASRRGSPATWRVRQLPDPRAVSVRCDGQEFHDWKVTGADSIEIRSTVDTRRFRIVTGSRRQPSDASGERRRTRAEPGGTAGAGSAAVGQGRYVLSVPRSGCCCPMP